jgi:uncharacterized membrane protein
MANSKARSGGRPASAKAGRPSGGASSRSARTVAAVSATPTSNRAARPAKAEEFDPEEPAEEMYSEPEPEPQTGPPLWLQLVTFVLAILGLAISAYETYAHFNGSHLAGCPTGGSGTFNCTAVITSPQSMVFGVIPVAVLGLAFYVAAVPLFSPWAWRLQWRALNMLRLLSTVIGVGFVVYLIYAELYQIRDICEYCTGVHIVTFLLFCITVFSAAIWGLGTNRDAPRWLTRAGKA